MAFPAQYMFKDVPHPEPGDDPVVLPEGFVTTGRPLLAIALDLPLAEGLTKADLLKAIEGHIIGQGSLVAIYERKPKQ